MDDYGNVINNMAAYCNPMRPAMVATKQAWEYLQTCMRFYAELH